MEEDKLENAYLGKPKKVLHLQSKLKTQKSYIKSPDKACTEAIPPRLNSSIITPLPEVLPF